eukprot:gb/GECG01016486.1/.p1 GENE.gb/GECG01016486.1/~~gb/GECG01016486.1/.p1  ORF type:complete len:237 (+),score=23.37 gb/GECG01016486.1/:1-711(+)
MMRRILTPSVQKLQKPFQRALTGGNRTSTTFVFPYNRALSYSASTCGHKELWSPNVQGQHCLKDHQRQPALSATRQYHSSGNCSCTSHTQTQTQTQTHQGHDASSTQPQVHEGEEQEEGSDVPLPGARHGGEKFAMLMTCTVCETRAAKVVTKQAYYEGVVLARCPGCENLHLIADRLGWFEDGGVDIQQLLERDGRGDQFSQQTVGNEGGVLELTMEDWKALKSTDKTKFTNSDD